jgi:transposase InsO family protein
LAVTEIQPTPLGQEAELSDNGSSYVSGELAIWLGDKKMAHVRSAPYHPQTQGKIERWHQTLKKRKSPSEWLLRGLIGVISEGYPVDRLQ